MTAREANYLILAAGAVSLLVLLFGRPDAPRHRVAGPCEVPR
ncbi:hypothetical protein [Geminicoccus harenae]|nr:hypothetical protein [Geminicoccus harenae]